ncbi:protein of unknown function [Streptococcus thermophilus]|nr:protein of unknown function [Streptococcus thermophilus]
MTPYKKPEKVARDVRRHLAVALLRHEKGAGVNFKPYLGYLYP